MTAAPLRRWGPRFPHRRRFLPAIDRTAARCETSALKDVRISSERNHPVLFQDTRHQPLVQSPTVIALPRGIVASTLLPALGARCSVASLVTVPESEQAASRPTSSSAKPVRRSRPRSAMPVIVRPAVSVLRHACTSLPGSRPGGLSTHCLEQPPVAGRLEAAAEACPSVPTAAGTLDRPVLSAGTSGRSVTVPRDARTGI